jgi:hypothetical protein
MACAGRPLSLPFNIESLPNDLQKKCWNYYEQFGSEVGSRNVKQKIKEKS